MSKEEVNCRLGGPCYEAVRYANDLFAHYFLKKYDAKNFIFCDVKVK